MRARRAVLGLLVVAACKDKSAQAPSAPTPSAPAAPAAPVAPVDAPALAPDAAAVTPQPLTLDDALAQLPRLDGDTMIPLKTTGDGLQVRGTWCVAGTGADAVAESLATTMTTAGWSEVSTRGDANKAGVQGDRGGYRLSYVVSASTAANCRAPGHYFASATLFRTR